MKIKKVMPSFNLANTYIVYDEKSLDGVMIDPGGMGEMLIKAAQEINIKYIFVTHAHFDHIGALEMVADKLSAQVVIHEIEAASLIDSKYNLCTFAGVEVNKRGADMTVSDNDTMKIGDIIFKFIHTPGHTKGGMCIFAGENDLITGDTLFKGSVGRTDFIGGDHIKLLESLKKIALLDNNIRIYPGHGEESTIGFEKKLNPYIKI